MFKPFVFDVDDTLVCCNSEMVRLIKRDYGFDCTPGLYLNAENSNGHHAAVLERAEFMETSPLFPHTAALFDVLPDLYADGQRFSVCTHRGYHSQGRVHTESFLERAKVAQYFTDVFVLDYKTTPDKVEFLDAQYGSGQYWLFDDRPRYDGHHPVPEHIWLYDQPWNQHIQGNRTVDVLATIRHLIASDERARQGTPRRQLIEGV